MRISDWSSDVCSSDLSWTKQVFESVLSNSSAAFREVVLIEYPRTGCWAIGFITGKTVGEVQRLTDAVVYNVFVPATPNPTTGFLLFVPHEAVYHLDLTVEEGIKLVISGAIVDRKGVVSGKSVSVGVVPVGRRVIKKKKKKH